MGRESSARGALALVLICGVSQVLGTRAEAAGLFHGATPVPGAFARPLMLPIEMAAADSLSRAPGAPPAGCAGAGADKFQHAGLSAALGLGAGALSRSGAAALAVPLALGLAKEFRDRRHTRFDPWDLAADAVGALAAAAITAAIVHD